MTARTPEEVHQRWLQAINDGDLDALMGLYEPEATVAFGPGQVATGLAAIREGNQQLLALRPRFELRVAQVLVAGDLALLLSPWSMTGTWRFIIDNPMGSGAAAETPQG